MVWTRKPKDTPKKRSSFGPEVQKDILKKKKDLKIKGSHLLDNRMFDQEIGIENTEYVEKMFDELILDSLPAKYRKREIKLNDFSVMLANLYKGRTKYTSISKNDTNYNKKTDRYLMVSPFTIKLVDILEEKGMIEQNLGYRDSDNPHKNKNTRIIASRALIQRLEIIPIGLKKIESEEIIILTTKKDFKRDKDGKKIKIKPKKLPYKDNKITKPLRIKLEKINAVNNKAEIHLFIENKKVLKRLKDAYRNNNTVDIKSFCKGGCIEVHTQLKAIFKEDFKQYGRLHTGGWFSYQGFPQTSRMHLKINGSSTIELDYSGMHPRILYALKKEPFNGDPYELPAYDFETNKILRPFLKKILLACVNSKSFTKAEQACNGWLNFGFEKGKKKFTESNYKNLSFKDKEYFRNVQNVKALGIEKARPLLKEFEKLHEPIKEFFYSGETSLKTTNLDSKIAVHVCTYFAQRNYPILPIHDSFIIEEKHKALLKKIMNQAFKKYNKGFSCPIH